MECPKVANAIFVFVEIVKSNHQLSSKVGSVLTKLLCSRLDDDEMFERCKGLQKEKNDLACRVKSIMMEKDELSKVVADLKARLKVSESRLEESKLWAFKEREANKGLEEELPMYKKETVEQQEKGFHKAVR